MQDDAITRLARERLGFERLRPGQHQAIAAAAAGRDVLAVLPTGAGKSAIYELAGLLRDGPAVVVSPLIALQNDQLAHLRAAGLSATVVNSQQSATARANALADPGQFVFLSPEQLSNAETRAALRRARPSLFAVDEAHLVSQWGQDFRPDYLRLGADAEELGVPVRLALTATAAPPVRDEIVRRLRLRDPEIVIGDFDRPHIELSVEHVASPKDKLRDRPDRLRARRLGAARRRPRLPGRLLPGARARGPRRQGRAGAPALPPAGPRHRAPSDGARSVGRSGRRDGAAAGRRSGRGARLAARASGCQRAARTRRPRGGPCSRSARRPRRRVLAGRRHGRLDRHPDRHRRPRRVAAGDRARASRSPSAAAWPASAGARAPCSATTATR